VRLTFAGGGWVLALALLVSLLFALRMVLPALAERGKQRGDGKDARTYGFDLSTCLIPREQLIPAVPVDRIAALYSPPTLPGAQLDAYNQEQREHHQRKFVVSTDRVAGVVLNCEARAYPLNVLCWHEACNDTLGGMPICVSFSPLCDSVVVFERRTSEGELAFGVSGLVYNSNLVLYDRRDGHAGESLWSQLGLRAIAGPAAMRSAMLKPLPVEVTQWADWLARYPQTSVILGDAAYGDRYNMSPYGGYLQAGELKYPVTPTPPAAGPAAFSRVLAVQGLDGWRVFPYQEIAAHAASGGEWREGGVTFHYTPESAAMDPPVVFITGAVGGIAPASITALWFAWQAMHPGIGANNSNRGISR
jgi:hypothetical protein